MALNLSERPIWHCQIHDDPNGRRRREMASSGYVCCPPHQAADRYGQVKKTSSRTGRRLSHYSGMVPRMVEAVRRLRAQPVTQRALASPQTTISFSVLLRGFQPWHWIRLGLVLQPARLM